MSDPWTRLKEIADELAVLAQQQITTGAAVEPPVVTVPPTAVPPPLAWGAKVSAVFRDRVRLTGQDFRLDPNWLMAVMGFETGHTFSPSIRNPASSAVGLIQFLEATANDLGTTTAALATMTAEDQFDYVWLYYRDRIRERGAITNLGDAYMAVLNPVAMGKPDSFVMWVAGSSAYAANAGLDTNKDHQITKAEATALVMRSLADGLRPENVG